MEMDEVNRILSQKIITGRGEDWNCKYCIHNPPRSSDEERECIECRDGINFDGVMPRHQEHLKERD